MYTVDCELIDTCILLQISNPVSYWATHGHNHKKTGEAKPGWALSKSPGWDNLALLSKYSSLYFIKYCTSYYLTDKGMRPIGAS